MSCIVMQCRAEIDRDVSVRARVALQESFFLHDLLDRFGVAGNEIGENFRPFRRDDDDVLQAYVDLSSGTRRAGSIVNTIPGFKGPACGPSSWVAMPTQWPREASGFPADSR